MRSVSSRSAKGEISHPLPATRAQIQFWSSAPFGEMYSLTLASGESFFSNGLALLSLPSTSTRTVLLGMLTTCSANTLQSFNFGCRGYGVGADP